MTRVPPSDGATGPTSAARRARLKWMLAAAVALVLVSAQVGCASVGFYWQAARGQLDVLSRRVPVEEALADPVLGEPQRSRLQAAFEARVFASDALGLPDNRSYRSYADLERPYALWNVFAAPEFSITPHTWCYPFAGCVSYRGYFSEDAARRQVEALRADGFDAFYGGVAAYSTLGTFADPILNTMLRQDELDTVALIFHELSHQRLYRAGDAAFSESFASFVEREGVRRWLDTGRAGRNYADYLASLERQREFAGLIGAARESLAALYAQPLPPGTMRARKAERFAQLRQDYRALRDRWGGYAGYDAWFERDLNNAHVTSVATYERWVPAFAELLHEAGDDLPAFYAAAEALSELDDAALVEALERLAAAAARRDDGVADARALRPAQTR